MNRSTLPAPGLAIPDRTVPRIATTARLDDLDITSTVAAIPDAYSAARHECNADAPYFGGSKLAPLFRRFEKACMGLIQQYIATVRFLEMGDVPAPGKRALFWWIEEFSVSRIELCFACEQHAKPSCQRLDLGAYCIENGDGARHRNQDGSVTIYQATRDYRR